MTLPNSFVDPTYRIYLSLAQYPVLQTRIRVRMRHELFNRGVMTAAEFQQQVNDQAISSQSREGLTDPYGEEPEDVWRTRLDKVRDYLTDLHFAQNLSFELFEEIVRDTLTERGAEAHDEAWLVGLNVELAPVELLIEQVRAIRKLPARKQEQYKHRLQEIKVVLIRTMISDQLKYIKIAKNYFELDDLLKLRERKIGKGRVGGKAAGMLLAKRIVEGMDDPALCDSIKIPKSYFLSADVMYAFMAYNDLMNWAEQKYKPDEEIRSDFPKLQAEYAKSVFPPDIHEELQDILHKTKGKPVIVRSSSLLEDNFGTSFAGKYESYFCPNQGTDEENMEAFTKAIAAVYASALSADALVYRRNNDLIDYDERIAILIQVVEGEEVGDYYLPHAAGVAFSRNLYRWSPQIERDAGFVRLVWGMGTRAVDRVGNDYPRMVALSHPLLHSHDDPRAIVSYSQRFVDLIDLKANEFKTLPIEEVLHSRYPVLRYIARRYEDGYLSPIRSNLMGQDFKDIVITFDELLRRTPFAERMSKMLQFLEKHYRSPVDMEFTVRIKDVSAVQPEIEITILQCRPQSHLEGALVEIPQDLPAEDILLSTDRVLLRGSVPDIRYVLYVSPEGYFSLQTPAARHELTRSIGRLDARLEDEVFICVGPGRWGTTNPDLGVRIGYGDIFHSRALVELSGKGVGTAPEPSFGTHFFQDLIESEIYPMAVFLDDKEAVFNEEFFEKSPNHLLDFLPDAQAMTECLYLLDIEDFRAGQRLTLAMDDEAGQGVVYVQPRPDDDKEEEEVEEA